MKFNSLLSWGREEEDQSISLIKQGDDGESDGA